MLVCAKCIPCYLKQAMNTLSRTGLPDCEIYAILEKLCLEIPKLAADRTPAENSSYLLHRVCELAGVPDPFERDKAESNRQAIALWPELRELINGSEDPLYTAIKVAVAGNVVDLGILDGYDLKGSLRQVLGTSFARDDVAEFAQLVGQKGDILYIGDNSGEIAFDRLLVEQLVQRGCRVTFAVKEGPVLNDATKTDAGMVGLSELAEVITTGSNFLGVIPERVSAKFTNLIDKSGCILAKGQANYESLEGERKLKGKTFFALKAKCEIVAANLGVKFGDIVFARHM